MWYRGRNERIGQRGEAPNSRVGDRIRITIQDDVGVATVDVTLTTIDGTTIEKGQAVEPWPGTGQWEYMATVPVAPGTQVFVEAALLTAPDIAPSRRTTSLSARGTNLRGSIPSALNPISSRRLAATKKGTQ